MESAPPLQEAEHFLELLDACALAVVAVCGNDLFPFSGFMKSLVILCKVNIRKLQNLKEMDDRSYGRDRPTWGTIVESRLGLPTPTPTGSFTNLRRQ
jgi:hypothetical protein